MEKGKSNELLLSIILILLWLNSFVVAIGISDNYSMRNYILILLIMFSLIFIGFSVSRRGIIISEYKYCLLYCLPIVVTAFCGGTSDLQLYVLTLMTSIVVFYIICYRKINIPYNLIGIIAFIFLVVVILVSERQFESIRNLVFFSVDRYLYINPTTGKEFSFTAISQMVGLLGIIVYSSSYKSLRKKIFSLIIIGVTCLVMATQFGKVGPLLSMVLSIIIVDLILKKEKKNIFNNVIFIAIFFSAFILIYISKFVPSIGVFINSMSSNRIRVFTAIYDQCKSSGLIRLIFGKGLYTTSNVLVDGAFTYHPHNSYLSVLHQFGVVGICSFFVVLYAAWKNQIRILKEQGEVKKLYLLLYAMLLMTSDDYFVYVVSNLLLLIIIFSSLVGTEKGR